MAPGAPIRIATSTSAMVATQRHEATSAAVETLDQGGNVVDAAVAAAFALCVCEPAACGLGGQTMLVVHIAQERRTFALDGSSRAPNRTREERPTGRRLFRGHGATTVPSTPAVLAYALDRYGTLPLARVLDPAIRLAEDGFEVTPLLHRLMKREVRGLRGGTAASLLLEDSRRPHRVGAILRLHPLAATLRALQEEGIEEFYTGGIARAIVTDMELHGGLIEPADLAQIPWPVERRPVSGTFGFAKVRALPFPGAGSTLIQMLQLVNQMPAGLDLRSPADALMVIEIIRRGFLDRADRPFDPSFYASVEDRTRDPDYARMVARHIRRRTRRPRVEPGGETTHLSVCDSRGNAVSLTQSIERVFGSCEASPELGFLYNNYMSAFEREDISHPYYLRPNAVPWATVAPTILLRGGAPWIVIGSPGSERIGSSVLQVLMRLDHEGPEAAVAAPRFHCSLGGEVTLEECDSSDQLTELLEQSGFTVRRHERFSFHHGCVQLVLREKGRLIGVADPRRDGSAGGPSVA